MVLQRVTEKKGRYILVSKLSIGAVVFLGGIRRFLAYDDDDDDDIW